ncbi:NAD(P)/FAD-dependent oxidoreductase [Sphingorhabdus sp.]|jgi:gamma-glutamylputrescine oxidase|uniref:NAD(P)/FAD-dependent oxidoreductase n=1 Tax=Sphingorhabdus sp. TaxID=1902408 RepID=UPI003BAE66AC|nr:FAD-binding oxidoreductase [Sphingomonadales bacterium]MBK9433398.1 FAD-binding oxidoreductase [Sphingomonadales bacterium]MBL0020960.1 FAD-binding oxidoreductase [Sphingomonadales bacterium]
MSDPLNNSYYAATANAWKTQPAYTGEGGFDVAVIGGGFTGLSAALACAEKGLQVALFEAQTIGFGASGRNGGQLIPGLRWSMREIDAEFGRERAKAIFDLAYGAVERVKDRIATHGIKCDLKAGHLEAAYKPDHFDAMQRDSEFLATQFGWESNIVQPQDMRRHIDGGGYHGGIYDPQGGHFHPLNYALGLAQAAKAAGVAIFENSSVSADAIDTRAVILATDTWMNDQDRALGRHTIPIMNYNVATASLPDADRLFPSDAAVADSRFVLNYFRLSADKRLLFGGGEKYVQTPPADIAAFVRKHIVEVFPTLADTPIEYAWGGPVGVTMNRLPHIGRKGNVFFAHGFSGHGALVTTLAGELLAEAVTGTMERFDVFANLPHRPFPGGRLFARPLATLGLLYYALKDRL